MSTTTTHLPFERPQAELSKLTSHIVVATAGNAGVSPAIRVARAIADRHGSEVEVLSIVEPNASVPVISDAGLVAPIIPIAPSAAELQKRRYRISDELARAGRPD